jgi:hypothetical protein
MIGGLTDNGLEAIRKEAVLAKALNHYLSRITEENHEKPQDICFPGRGLNVSHPEQEEMLTTG